VELSSALHVFQLFATEPINVVADSAYVEGIVQRIENAMIKEVTNKHLFSLLIELATLLKNRTQLYFIMHIRSHTNLPGPIAEGNAVADQLTMAAILPRTFEQARWSHDFFHQNASSLRKQFSLSRQQTNEIVRACPDCQRLTSVTSRFGVNP
ncbi:POK18 protein, partial [Chunga burmeisteri]|nr:POK18 protein [Chunga burmeisteri]